ncbi:MAG: DUF11 domain-containing protein [Clostridia bacterium]|nr:DUF11 domain-containing protein [Clostridia bacterium]
MRNCKKILIVFMIITIIMPICLSMKVEAANGAAVISSRPPKDKEGNTITWDGHTRNIFIDEKSNYLNLYCMDAGTYRSTSQELIDEKHISDFLKIDNTTKFNIFETEADYNSTVWFADNMYLWQYNNENATALKEENIKTIKNIIKSKKDYLKNSHNIVITDEWIDNTMFKAININKFEDAIIELNIAIMWQLVRNTVTDSNASGVEEAENLVKSHMNVKHNYNGSYYTECDGNILCLWRDNNGAGGKHFNFYDNNSDNENIQKALKAYYFAMLKTARENSKYTRPKQITIDETKAETNLTENKIGPFTFTNYNKNYIESYKLNINDKEISNDLYKVNTNNNGEFYIELDKTILEKPGEYSISLDVNYNYGIFRNLYVVGNTISGKQPLLSTNYNNKPLTATHTIIDTITIKETTTELEKEYPNIKVTKTADKTVVVEGDKVTYTISVENIGNVNLSNVVVKDEMLNINKTIESLDVGKSEILTGTYSVTKIDIENEKEITNTVTVTAKYKENNLSASATATIVPKIIIKEEIETEVEVEKEFPNLKVTKTSDKTVVEEGDEVTYTILVENIGNVDLENLVVKDEMLGINKTIEKLEAGKSETLKGTYTITKNDIEKEDGITNTVTVTTSYKDKQLLASDTATIVPKIVKKEQVTVEVEKEVIKVVEKEVPVEVEKVVEKEVYVQKDSTTATTNIPKAGSKYILIFIASIMMISICSYVFYKKNKIK